jgi:hypothetical protein
MQARLSDKRPLSLNLGAVSFKGTHCLLGTTDPDEKDHFLIVADMEKMQARTDPIVSWCQPPEVSAMSQTARCHTLTGRAVFFSTHIACA